MFGNHKKILNRKTRKAFIGLSTPILYDYRNLSQKTSSDTKCNPNPILESPFGLLLLFDEIYFVCRSLCPENMRHLSYIHFLDEENLLSPELIRNYFNNLFDAMTHGKYNDYEVAYNFNKGIRELKTEWDIKWLQKASDHSHELSIKGLEPLGPFCKGSHEIMQLVLDLLIYDGLGISGMEFITNSFTSAMLDKHNESLDRTNFVELLLIENIPNYLSAVGPYHQCIEEIREDIYLKEFRKWISSKKLHSSKSELMEVKKSVESSLQEAQEKVFVKYFKDHSFFRSYGKSIISDMLGFFIPGLSTASNIGENLLNKNIAHKWQSFLVSARRKISI